MTGTWEQDPAAQRMVTEPPKDPRRGSDQRTPYQRDRGRVLHSAAFRRLAAKTQVHTFSDDQFVRTRLTHSLEVAQIARDIGFRLGCDPDVVDTAGLAHDLGHPPFGHAGEEALHQAAATCGGFEGNAQTLRLLTRLEAKVMAPDGTPAGLNLTRATLDAVTKYPWPAAAGRAKFGAYTDDLTVYTWLRDGRPDGRRCLEAQVMDWADDVAYSVHDVEDGIHAHQIAFGALRHDPDERAALCADAAGQYSPAPAADLAEALVDLLGEDIVTPLERYDASHAAQVALKRLTSTLTGRFIADTVAATRAAHGPGPLRRYQADLVVPARTRAQVALLKAMALRYVMRTPRATACRASQSELVSALVVHVLAQAPGSLEPAFAHLWSEAPDDPGRLRVVIDQVACLTDPAALAWARTAGIPGTGIPGIRGEPQ